MTQHLNKVLKIILLLFLVLALALLIFYLQYEPSEDIQWGVNFSILHAAYLHDNWREMFIEILDDLKPERIRTMAYWSIIEPDRGQFDFSSIDFLLIESKRRNTDVILVLGPKQPRWPECHVPAWYEALPKTERGQAVRTMLETAVNHFKEFDNIVAWQIENEPFFKFAAECSVIPWGEIREEVALVKNLDDRPVIITDSGEWGTWLPAGWTGADILGSTMYRTVYHGEKEQYVTFRIPPILYQFRAGILQSLTGTKQVIGIELQAEPWFVTDVLSTPLELQLELMNPEIFIEHVEYAKQVGFVENYFWGVEWWYWLREQGEPEMWITAKEVLK